jgi:hypothetical protein
MVISSVVDCGQALGGGGTPYRAADKRIAAVTMVLSNPRRTRSAAEAPMSYELLITSIAEVHARTQTGAAGAVNRYLTLRNWFIGAYVVQFEQNGADRAGGSQTDTESALPPQDKAAAVATSVVHITQTSRRTVRAKTHEATDHGS